MKVLRVRNLSRKYVNMFNRGDVLTNAKGYNFKAVLILFLLFLCTGEQSIMTRHAQKEIFTHKRKKGRVLNVCA